MEYAYAGIEKDTSNQNRDLPESNTRRQTSPVSHSVLQHLINH